MPHPKEDNIHLRDTVRIQREDGEGTKFGGSALGPVKVLPGGGILPVDITELYPGIDLTSAVSATSCFMDRYRDCKGEKANCPSMQSVVLCEHHHNQAHGREDHAIEKGSFTCLFGT